MRVWDSLVGQGQAVDVLMKAAWASRIGDATVAQPEGSADPRAEGLSTQAMAQAWLITGPPGSGRSNAALAFAAALECTGETPGCGTCNECRSVIARVHPDVRHLDAVGVTITVEETRAMVADSYTFPSIGRRRVIIIEDADRMLERTTNVLLKAIEEPPAETVWILIAPSAEDMLPTIRSRCRHVALVVPPAQAVAELLQNRYAVEPEQALHFARAAQSHIGRAAGLATDAETRDHRQLTIRAALGVQSTGEAVLAAMRLFNGYEDSEGKKAREQEAKAYGKAHPDDEEAQDPSLTAEEKGERKDLKRQLGVETSRELKPAQRGMWRDLIKMQEKRRTRAVRDRLDLALLDLLAVYRDVLTVQVGAQVPLVNEDFSAQITQVAASTSPLLTVHRMDAISTARERLAANVAPQLALEAMFVSLRPSALGA